MKKFSLGLVVGFLLSWSFTFASPAFDHNGNFWNKLDNSAKKGYIDGYGDAMQTSVGKLDSLSIAAELFHWKGAKKIIHQLSTELSISQLTPEQAVARLNSLYSSRKYSELDLGSALELLTMRAPAEHPPAATQMPPEQKAAPALQR